MEQIEVTARFSNIPSANNAAFKELAAQAMTITKSEAGALRYDWYFSEDESQCLVHEAYGDSNAVLAHVAGLGVLFGQLLEVGGGCTFDVCGSPSPELVAATAGLQLSVFSSHFQGN
jgi:quinol monooxygenase YgiN